DRFTPEAREQRRSGARKLYGYTEEQFIILLIGNDWKKKGVDTLIKAAKHLGDLHLRVLVVGSDDPGLYHSLMHESGMQDRVRFEKPRRDVLDFYAAADLYAGPSLEDAFNLPILEAMACGLPVIASVQAGASELIHDAETGLLLQNPQDHEELSELIGRIVGDPRLGVRLGEAASKHVRTHCNWDENAEQTSKALLAAFQGRRKTDSTAREGL